MAEFKYEITERIAVLSQSPNGWERQLNMVSWNDREPKYDIRDWAPDNSKMGKGISLTHDELAILKGILNDLEIRRYGLQSRVYPYFFRKCLPPRRAAAAGLAGDHGFLYGSGLHAFSRRVRMRPCDAQHQRV